MDQIVATYANAHDDGVTCLRRINSTNLNTLITTGMGGKINFLDPTRLDTAHASALQTVFQSDTGIVAVDWSERRHSLYTGDYSQKINIYDVAVRKKTGALGSYGQTGHRDMLVSVACNDDRNQIISTDAGGVIKVWDTRTLRCLQTTRDPEQDKASGLTACVTNDEENIITGGAFLHRW